MELELCLANKWEFHSATLRHVYLPRWQSSNQASKMLYLSPSGQNTASRAGLFDQSEFPISIFTSGSYTKDIYNIPFQYTAVDLF